CYRSIVIDQWAGRPSGGPVALFSGPSGTGKTLAASVIASELGWPLYRVDLGSLISKYIGETEKNLKVVFSAVHGRPAVLQFDEADSLFGKRGEIREARDRYANLEVSHLRPRGARPSPHPGGRSRSPRHRAPGRTLYPEKKRRGQSPPRSRPPVPDGD